MEKLKRYVSVIREDFMDEFENRTIGDFNSCINCANYNHGNDTCGIIQEVINIHGDIVLDWLKYSSDPNFCSFYEEEYAYIEGDDLEDTLYDDELEDFIDDDYETGGFNNSYDMENSYYEKTIIKKKPKGGGQYKKVTTIKIDPKTKAKTKVIKWVKVGGVKKAKDVTRARKAAKTKKSDVSGKRLAKKRRKKTLKVKKQMGLK